MAEIHRITSRNAALLDSVAEEVFDERIDARCLQAYLADAAHLMLVAVEEGRVVGQCRAVVHLQPDQAPELYLDNLGVANTAQLEDTLTQKESDWLDLFFAYAHNKRISFVIAYAILGDITLTPDQHGFYFSTHLTF